MSGVAIVNYLLSNNAGLTAVVNSAQIISGVIPVGTPQPAISVIKISAIGRKSVSMAESNIVIERVQVTILAKSYASAKSILASVISALPLSKSTVNGFLCDSVLPDTEGPDIFDPDALLYMQTMDFMVRFSS